MKLLVVSQYYWPEPFRITDICEALVERGHSVDVLTSVPNVPQGKFYEGYGWFKRGEKEHNGVRIERVGVVQRKTGSALRLALNCASFAINSLFHIRKLKKNDYDAVFVFNNSPVTKLIPARAIAKKKKIPNIVFLLDIWPQSMFFLLGMKESDRKTLFRRISYKFSSWLYRSVDLMLISSRGFEEKLREMGIQCEMEYFPNYAEEYPKTDFCVTRNELGLAEQDFVIAFTGNVGKAQGLDQTVDATAASMNKAVKWLVVGDGPELESLKQKVQDKGLEDSYRFTGWVKGENLPAYLDLADAAFLPLKDQEVLNLTIPAKLQTYMYAGKPVLAFMNGAGMELVEETGCGIAAKAEDTAALAKAIDEMASLSVEQRKEMGERGRAYCETHYNRDKQIDRLVALIDKAVHDYHR